jgi:hypothetical protein
MSLKVQIQIFVDYSMFFHNEVDHSSNILTINMFGYIYFSKLNTGYVTKAKAICLLA